MEVTNLKVKKTCILTKIKELRCPGLLHLLPAMNNIRVISNKFSKIASLPFILKFGTLIRNKLLVIPVKRLQLLRFIGRLGYVGF
jgi:hypothetical protein